MSIDFTRNLVKKICFRLNHQTSRHSKDIWQPLICSMDKAKNIIKKKEKKVKCHFTLELECPWPMIYKSIDWYNQRLWQAINLSLVLERKRLIIVGSWTKFFLSLSINQHCPLSLTTKLYDPFIERWDFYCPQYSPWMIFFKSPSIFTVDALGPCIKRP